MAQAVRHLGGSDPKIAMIPGIYAFHAVLRDQFIWLDFNGQTVEHHDGRTPERAEDIETLGPQSLRGAPPWLSNDRLPHFR